MFSGFGSGGIGGNDIAAFIGLEGINQFQTDIGKADTSVKKLEGTFKISGTAIAAAATGIGVAIAGMAAKVINSSLDSAKEFEFLRVRLQNMYGDVQRGNEAFATFNQLAATTPFELKQVVEAGAGLKAFGLDAEKTLKITADLAAFMGIDIVDAAQAMGRAFAGGAGAADIFRERGILNLIKTRQQIDDFKNITLEEFRAAMFRTFTDPEAGIVGATDKLSQTIIGLESNASDAFTRLGALVGERFAPAYKSALTEVTQITDTLIATFTDFSSDVDRIIGQIASTLSKLGTLKEFQTVIEQFKKLRELVLQGKGFGLDAFSDQVDNLIRVFPFLTKEQRQSLITARDGIQQYSALSGVIEDLESKLGKTMLGWGEFNIEFDAFDLTTGKMIPKLKDFNNTVGENTIAIISYKNGIAVANLELEKFITNTEIQMGNLKEIPVPEPPDPQPFWEIVEPIEAMGISADRAWEIIADGASRTASFVTESFFDKKVQFKQLWQSIAKDFIQMFLEEILQQTIKYVAKLIALLIFFDKYENDMKALQSGRDYAKYFSTGVISGLQKNLDPNIIDRFTSSALDLSGSIREGLNGEQILKVEVETVPIEDARARAYFIRQNREVIMPDQDYINTFLRTKKGEFDK